MAFRNTTSYADLPVTEDDLGPDWMYVSAAEKRKAERDSGSSAAYGRPEKNMNGYEGPTGRLDFRTLGLPNDGTTVDKYTDTEFIRNVLFPVIGEAYRRWGGTPNEIDQAVACAIYASADSGEGALLTLQD